jgi:hypothetical protein
MMEWVLFVSLQWIVFGSPTQPSTEVIQSFPSEELCNKAAESIRNEINVPFGGNQRVQIAHRGKAVAVAVVVVQAIAAIVMVPVRVASRLRRTGRKGHDQTDRGGNQSHSHKGLQKSCVFVPGEAGAF